MSTYHYIQNMHPDSIHRHSFHRIREPDIHFWIYHMPTRMVLGIYRHLCSPITKPVIDKEKILLEFWNYVWKMQCNFDYSRYVRVILFTRHNHCAPERICFIHQIRPVDVQCSKGAHRMRLSFMMENNFSSGYFPYSFKYVLC